jgi:hypothetical protein
MHGLILVPGMGAVFDGFLTILAPLEAVVHDIHIRSSLDGVPGLSHPLGSAFLPWPVPGHNARTTQQINIS